MGVQASGPLSIPAAALRAMLANSATFQGWYPGDLATSQAYGAARAALAGITLFGKTVNPSTRPLAIVMASELSPEELAGGTHTFYKPHGRLQINIEKDVRTLGAITSQVSTTVFRDSQWERQSADFYNGLVMKILTGPCANESKEILDFDGTEGKFTLASALSALPVVGSTYQIDPASDEDAYLHFVNLIGKIAQDLLDLSGQGLDLTAADPTLPTSTGCLALRSVQIQDYGRSKPEEDKQDFIGARIEVEYGL